MRASRVCGTVSNLLGILLARQLLTTKQCGHSVAAEDLSDASLLLHTFLRVRDGLAEPPSPPKRLSEVVKEMRHLWKEHRREQMGLDRQRDLEEMKLRHRGEREPPTPPPPPTPQEASPEALQEAQRQKIMDEMKRAKYGEEMRLVVKDVLGREINMKFRDQTRLRVIMFSVCRRLALQQNETKFFHEDRELTPDETPLTFGLEDQDIIEVKSEELNRAHMQMLKQKEELARAEMLAAQAEQDLWKRKAQQEQKQAESRKQREVRMTKLADEMKQVQAKAEREKNGYIDLQFMDAKGALMHISVKRAIWLGGTMNLICKRMHMNAQRTCFLIEVTQAQIVARDTADSLGLDQDEIIRVTPCTNTTDEEAPWS